MRDVFAQGLPQLECLHRKRMVGQIANRSQHQVGKQGRICIDGIHRLARKQTESGAGDFAAKYVVDLQVGLLSSLFRLDTRNEFIRTVHVWTVKSEVTEVFLPEHNVEKGR